MFQRKWNTSLNGEKNFTWLWQLNYFIQNLSYFNNGITIALQQHCVAFHYMMCQTEVTLPNAKERKVYYKPRPADNLSHSTHYVSVVVTGYTERTPTHSGCKHNWHQICVNRSSDRKQCQTANWLLSYVAVLWYIPPRQALGSAGFSATRNQPQTPKTDWAHSPVHDDNVTP